MASRRTEELVEEYTRQAGVVSNLRDEPATPRELLTEQDLPPYPVLRLTKEREEGLEYDEVSNRIRVQEDIIEDQENTRRTFADLREDHPIIYSINDLLDTGAERLGQSIPLLSDNIDDRVKGYFATTMGSALAGGASALAYIETGDPFYLHSSEISLSLASASGVKLAQTGILDMATDVFYRSLADLEEKLDYQIDVVESTNPTSIN
ncbi:MAG: hypothetical protein SVS85_01500 [Candidatus Nanohaloarchaea archaeon]|nr:hypothetical protein [Candidatus Nanohaloarchaea archaeon]